MDKLVLLQMAQKEMMEKSIRNYKKDGSARRTESYYERKLLDLQKLWEGFKARHMEILVLRHSDPEADPQKYVERDIYSDVEEYFSDNYAYIEEQYKHEMSKKSKAPIPSQSTAEEKAHTSLKLPKISLEKFSGDYRKWPTFHDLFKSLVHNNHSLCSVQKLQYLKLHLSGEAENLLRHVQVTDNNYQSAWELLTERYNNKRVLVNTHLKVLLSQSSLSTESSQGIKSLLDTTMEVLQALQNLDIAIDNWDPILVYLIIQKLPSETHELWEQQVSSKGTDLPSWEDLKNFLQIRFRTLEAISSKRGGRDRTQFSKPKAFGQSSQQAFHIVTKGNCVVCLNNHSIRQCPKFSSANPTQRLEIVKAKGLCINCLGSGHILANCPSQQSCFQCRKRHHSLLHRTSGEFAPHSQSRISECSVVNGSCSQSNTVATTTTALSVDSPEFAPNLENPTTTLFTRGTPQNQILLATALVKIIASSGEEQVVRALIDQGSQSSFISAATVQKLKLQRQAIHAEINGVGKNSISRANYQAHFIIKPVRGEIRIPISGLILRDLTNVLPSSQISQRNWDHLKSLELADPSFYQPSEIDLLLGADVYGEIMLDGLIKGVKGSPTAQKTIFGWVLTGRTDNVETRAITVQNFHACTEINDQLKQFWELEEIPCTKFYTEEEQACEELFAKSCKRRSDGRYEVELPFKEETKTSYLGRSRHIAMIRLRQLENRFERNPSLKKEYSECLQEYVKLGHMVKVSSSEEEHAKLIDNVRSYSCCYLPHHGIIKETSSTTKLRVVFDASKTTYSGVSLNERLLKGPVLQDDLAALLLRWKKYQFVFTADIEKMYRQIRMQDEHCEYQRILWREDPELPLEDFKLLTVTFGTKSAPYLATRVIQQLARDERERFPIASEIALSDFYVDDLLSGTNSIHSALEAQRQLIGMMNSGGFSLRKWTSNCKALLQAVPEKHRETNLSLYIKEDPTVRTLGLHWNPATDCFSYSVCLDLEPAVWTKRTILSEISKLFDPLGWISPSLILAKIFIQKLWKENLGWDEKMEPVLEKEWCSYRENIKCLQELRLPRWIHYNPTDPIEIHGFADASTDAYAAVVYTCVINTAGERRVKLLTSKTKVAPIKTVSIPRLELCAAALLAKLMRYVMTAMKLENASIHAWTDSQIVLAWLASHPSNWTTFVANRVSKIHETIGEKVWSHVTSQDNPADCASRGILPSNLLTHELWWNGPKWLRNEKTSWPKARSIKPTNLETRKRTKAHIAITLDLESRYSSLAKLKRVTARCLRFIRNLNHNSEKIRCSYITATEMQEAMEILLRRSQAQYFQEEINRLKQKLPVGRKSQIFKLKPFLDAKNLIRVGGRLQNADLSFEEKHPIILPTKCHLTHLMIEELHRNTLHGSLQLMLNVLGKHYWLLNAKNTIRFHIHKCMPCYRQRASVQTQLMGNLPEPRVRVSRPFSYTGIDYCGPFELKTHKGRNAKKYKAYIAVFICMAVKAIHLELVTDLSADGFIAAFRRFSARRGKPVEIHCDCGTNFVGASKALTKLQQQMISQLDLEIGQAIEREGTTFKFIPPASPHFGGLWESGVRSTKYHLKRVSGNQILTFEELNTVLTQIEACLNSRPLCEKSSDPEDLNPLTPAHFLIGDLLLTTPEPMLLDMNINRLDRWQLLQSIYQSFWRRWSSEYLCRLQQRPKWASRNENIKVGDLVLLKQEDLPPTRWALGRILTTHPGSDGLVRVVTLKTKNSILKRPIAKICLLPIANQI